MHSLRRIAASGLTMMLASLATAPAASAHNPTGEFAPFAQCPLNRMSIEECIDTSITGGSYTLGSKTVPIVNPITLQGGYEGSPIEFFGAENGETLSKTPEPVPGGLSGLSAPGSWPAPEQAWFNNGISTGMTGVDATIELIAPATLVELSPENLLFETGTALGLQVVIQLENPLLGSNCFIGSQSSPVVLDLTSDTSGALSGSAGSISFNPSFTILTSEGTKLVEAGFAEPEAEGCGGIFSADVDPFINSKFGLSSSGNISLEGMLRVGEAAEVRAHDM